MNGKWRFNQYSGFDKEKLTQLNQIKPYSSFMGHSEAITDFIISSNSHSKLISCSLDKNIIVMII